MNPLSSLPKQDGFKFIGIDKDGGEHYCIVVKKSGRYFMNSNTIAYPDLVGWREQFSEGE
jgi:hypothetical protein